MRKTSLKFLSVVLSAALLIGAVPAIASAASEKIKPEHGPVFEQTKNQKALELKKEYSDGWKQAGEKGRFSCDMELGGEYFESGSWEYTLVDGQAIITCLFAEDGLSGRIDIPETIDGYPVTGLYWVNVWDGNVDIYIPDSVKEIDRDCFGDGIVSINVTDTNTNYSTVDGVLYNKDKTALLEYPNKQDTVFTVPDGVKTIADSAFSENGFVEQVTLPSGLTGIGRYAFAWCSQLKNIVLPEGLVEIGEHSFFECAQLEAVYFSSTVTTIGENAFVWCKNLESIEVDTENETFSSVDGILFNKDKTELLLCPEGMTSAEYTIPQTVEKIGNLAFAYCEDLKSVVLGENVSHIGERAFMACHGIEKMHITSGVIIIDEYAFSYCSELSEISFDDNPSLKVIGEWAFEDCYKLEKLVLPDSVENIGAFAFSSSGIERVYIPESVNKLDYTAFEYSDLMDVFYEGTREELSETICIAYDDIYSISDFFTLDYVRIIYGHDIVACGGSCGDNLTWYYDGLGALTISGTGKMDEFTTSNTCADETLCDNSWKDVAQQISTVIIEEGVTTVCNYAFFNCTDAIKFVLPESLEKIGHCNGIGGTIIYKGTPDKWREIEIVHGEYTQGCNWIADTIIYIDCGNNDWIDDFSILAASTSVNFGTSELLVARCCSDEGYPNLTFLPVDTAIAWFAWNDCFEYYPENNYCWVISALDGTTCFEASIVDYRSGKSVENSQGEAFTASIELESNAETWQIILYNIIAFFENLFYILFGWLM